MRRRGVSITKSSPSAKNIVPRDKTRLFPSVSFIAFTIETRATVGTRARARVS